MKKILTLNLVFLFSFTIANSQSSIIAGYRAINEFNSIPENYLPDAAKYRIMFRHASVGTTFNNALDCLQGTRSNPKECTEFPQYKYDRRNWACQLRGNSGWYGKVDDIVNEVQKQLDNFDIFSFKYCYLDGLDQVAEPCGSPMEASKVQKAWDSLRSKMEMLEMTYPEKKFIWWTIPLTQVGQRCTDTMNARIRQYCKDNGKLLFDIADMQCHDENGNPVITANGLEKAYKPFCGEQQEGAQSCHPNWTGSIRIAKAYWWLLARIAGWEGITGIEDNDSELNIVSNLLSNIEIFPNPATDNTIIKFRLKIPSKISIAVYDLFGREIISLLDKKILNSGPYSFNLDCKDYNASMYYIAIDTDRERIIGQLIIY